MFMEEEPLAPHSHDHDHGHTHGDGPGSSWREQWKLLTAGGLLILMSILEYGAGYVPAFPIDLLIYLAAYLMAGGSVLYLAWVKARRFDFFNEFFLMSVATIGAFAIGSYSEGVAVMVFYSIGEWFQERAVNNARRSIKALLDVRPERVDVVKGGEIEVTHPKDVEPGARIRVKPGEKVALDGILLSESASFNTSALTGESVPDRRLKGEQVLAGMINLDSVADIEVTAKFADSKLSRILHLVEEASGQKSQTQLFISRFAKVYTPIVFALAVLLCVVPYFLTDSYHFEEWFYRSLVFLVISCPCALVVSIPLGYFGGIGLASRNGILLKGSNYLDVLSNLDLVVSDKTGTMTEGVFEVQSVTVVDSVEEQDFLRLAAVVESQSTHPAARAVVGYAGESHLVSIGISDVREIEGKGLTAVADGKKVAAGSSKLMDLLGVAVPPEVREIPYTTVIISIDGVYSGHFVISDKIKKDAFATVAGLRKLGIDMVMLSGDKQSVVDDVAGQLSIKTAFGSLLPEDKVSRLQEFKDKGHRIAFVGDGVNDAPVVALADVGIAMGGLGSDATIETADVVIQNDQPSKIITAVKIGRITRRIVWQNIILAMVVKILVLALGAGGIASLWEAVIADVGVALVAILNAVRVQGMKNL